MKQPFTQAIENAELAIRNVDERNDIFSELLEGLGVGPVAGEVLLGGLNASPKLMQHAEQELIEEVQRRRQQQHQLQGVQGKRRKRPTMMRGMVI
ncbi:TPA: LcrG family type III secretion system chaperone VcrG [Vibrio parahaemolyticus]|uniref:LcrG family type III secretion system chaperone VcrG n=1 Tax=Vibrio parahaemolyticus TaxID=670 RepID=UPI0005F1EDCE|nr:LcrG family type III secretion system chaperone VcrG [Vibrio parahaemolyticus]EGR0770456.1 type III secretion protein LcrG [Vibrio parahaemolyticus]EGR0840214.1 type III secretion protein LcrG [Vibrio parahaemolyticus]EIZ0311170.1 LcrG family type III secretion system chaperone VcrG [Vibrio parahaemolyticus]EJG2230474.1 LcrG family type III secretion system chaperone VcrG [Vibrio parahaemolyticus]MDX1257180.1 LcrG family type III secretion system chaperone VcrG [Vibrio parahaemolyticus]